jgi:hypothetical protein
MGLLLAEGKRLKHLKENHTIKSRTKIEVFCGKELRSRCYGRAAILRLFVHPYDEDYYYYYYCCCPFPGNGSPME